MLGFGWANKIDNYYWTVNDLEAEQLKSPKLKLSMALRRVCIGRSAERNPLSGFIWTGSGVEIPLSVEIHRWQRYSIYGLRRLMKGEDLPTWRYQFSSIQKAMHRLKVPQVPRMQCPHP
jgi:hypothetical protein